jgi:serine/threonine protein kinase/formylglycine-generating enzyme required for sulfatase activity
MSDPRWERLKELFAAGLEVPAAERDAWLARSCNGDAELREELRALLVAHDTPSDFKLAVDDEEPDRVGSVLGDFELLEKLGQGGMGVVYRARQRSLGRDVAVKVLSARVSRNARAIERFNDEARRVGRVHHPGIAAVHAFGVEGRDAYLAMELVGGGDLHHALLAVGAARGSRPEAAGAGRGARTDAASANTPLPAFGTRNYYLAIARLAAAAARALQAAHESGIVHRDVKPQNILLTPEGAPKLVDFGIAHDARLGAPQALAELTGTPHYMSPEQAEIAHISVDHRTDIYSLGVVLFQMLTLDLPFDGETSNEVLERIRRFEFLDPRQANPDAPADLAAVCSQAMARDPGQRYATANAFADDLERFVRGEPVVAVVPSSLQRVGRWLRRRARSLGAATLVGGLAAAWLELDARRREDFDAERREQEQRLRTCSITLEIEGAAPSACRVNARRRAPDIERGLVEWIAFEAPTQVDGNRLVVSGLAPGDWWLHIDGGGAGRAEVRRYLELAENSVSARVRLHLDADVTADMVLVAGGDIALKHEFALPDGSLDPLSLCERVDAFWIDVEPLSCLEYQRFADATQRPYPVHWCGSLPESWRDRPVTMISYETALACAEWYGKRLATRAEMQLARGMESGAPFPLDPAGVSIAAPPGAFGAEPRPTRTLSETREDGFARLHSWFEAHVPPSNELPVGANGVRSSFGVLREWVDDVPIGGSRTDVKFDPTCRYRMGMACDERFAAVVARLGFEPPMAVLQTVAEPLVGFRCARTARF